MSDAGRVAINRPLTTDERELLMQVAIWCVAEQTGITDETAADVLDDLNERDGLYLEGDALDAYITTGTGKIILHCEREWLAFFAHQDEPVDLRKYAHPLNHNESPE